MPAIEEIRKRRAAFRFHPTVAEFDFLLSEIARIEQETMDRCAKACDDEIVVDRDRLTDSAYNRACEDCAASIRSLSPTTK